MGILKGTVDKITECWAARWRIESDRARSSEGGQTFIINLSLIARIFLCTIEVESIPSRSTRISYVYHTFRVQLSVTSVVCSR